jgi:hypothetical protein
MVDHLHPIRGLHTVDGVKVGEICQRSAQLNNPLRAFIVPHPPLKTGQGRWECLDGDTSNKLAAELMVDMAAYAAAPMPPAQVSQFIPDIEGDVLLVREDDDHLAVDDVAALCRDVQGWMASVTQGQQQPAQENNHQQQHANAVGGAHPPQVWQDDRTIPCLRTRVKRSGGWDNLAAAILFEGFSFHKPAYLYEADVSEEEEDMMDMEPAEEPAEEYVEEYAEEQAEEQEEGDDQEEMVYQYYYPSPPPRRYNYSAEIKPENEVPRFEPMEE